MITTVCKISYGSQTVPPIVPAVQGDTGRAISFEIADFTPPAGATATYFILKPSGEAIYNSATITDNSILCELTAQSLAEAGENRMQVRVLQGEDIVTSFEVILMVRTFLGDDAIESGTEMNIFDQAVEQATEQFQENAEQIVEEVIQSIPSDYTELTEEVDELNERIDYETDIISALTGSKVVKEYDYSMSGTNSSAWQVNAPSEITPGDGIALVSTTNVTATGRKMWYRVYFTDETNYSIQITDIGKIYRLDVPNTKVVSHIDIMFSRADSALAVDTTSTFKYIIIRGKDIPATTNYLYGTKIFALGHIVGMINYDRTNGVVSGPGGQFYGTGTGNFSVDSASLSTANVGVYFVLCVNYATSAYELINYTDFDDYINNGTYRAIALFRKDTNYFTSPFQCTVNGVNPTVIVDNTLSVENASADAKATGLLHDFVAGHVVGKINFHTSNRTIDVPGGHFYIAGSTSHVDIPTATVDYSQAYVFQVLCVDFETKTYKAVPYTQYCSASATKYGALAVFRNATPQDIASPYQILINGFSPVTLNESGVPYYWVSELESKIDQVALLQTYEKGISFGFITDIHWETNFQNSPALLEYVAKHSRLDMWINGGDSATGDADDGEDQIKNLYECIGSYNRNFKFYSVIGNHDDNSIPSGHTTLDSSTLYNLVMPDYNDITFGDGNYYWFDYRGTRFVCLDTKNVGASDPTQITWAANVISNSTLPVIVVMHIIKVFNSDESPCAFFNDLITAIGSNSPVEMIIGGHSHVDYNFIASNGIPVVVLDTDSKSSDDGISRVSGTISEQCFSAVTVDYDNKVINVTRFGSIGSNITINYSTT